MDEPAEHRAHVNGIDLTWFEWGRSFSSRGPAVLLAHATGFHARCWDPVVDLLGERHVIALDQRGHGRSEKLEVTHWEVFGRDLAAFVAELDLQDVLGVGHSMGGHAMVDAAASESARFRSLLLIDPVIAAGDAYGEGGWTVSSLDGESHPTSRRKRHFDSPEAMIERFRDRPPYRSFHPDALRAYCTHGLLAAKDGQGFDLACPPEVEASIYMSARTNGGVLESVRSIEIPVLVARAKLPPPDRDVMDFSNSPTWPGLAGEFKDARDIHFSDRTHFLPMEIPDRIAELILEELERP